MILQVNIFDFNPCLITTNLIGFYSVALCYCMVLLCRYRITIYCSISIYKIPTLLNCEWLTAMNNDWGYQIKLTQVLHLRYSTDQLFSCENLCLVGHTYWRMGLADKSEVFPLSGISVQTMSSLGRL